MDTPMVPVLPDRLIDRLTADDAMVIAIVMLCFSILIVQMVLYLRDRKKYVATLVEMAENSRAQLVDVVRSVTGVIDRNTAAIEKVHDTAVSTERALEAMKDRLIGSPCLLASDPALRRAWEDTLARVNLSTGEVTHGTH